MGAGGVAGGGAIIDLDVAAFRPPQILQPLAKRGDPCLPLCIGLGEWRKHADAPHALGLLRPGRKRPSHRCATHQRDELAPHHSITSSARASRVAGTSMLSVFAVCRLMTNSNLVGRSTGMSAGFAPLRMRPV